MAFARIQGAGHGLVSAATSNTVTLSATSVNNLVVVNFILDSQSVTGISVTDNASTPNTYAQAGSQVNFTGGNFSAVRQFYGVQVTGGATQIIISWTGSQICTAVADEFSGGNTTNATVFDKSSTGSAASGSSSSVTSFTPTANGELIVGGIGQDLSTGSKAGGTNYTLGTIDPSYASLFSIYRLASSGAETAPSSWTTSTSWGEIAGAYIAAPSGGSAQEFLMYNNVGMGR